jgi:hypothetical protein
MDPVPEHMVMISASRLATLEAAATRLAKAEEQLAKRNNRNLARLLAFKEANPEKAAELAVARSKRYMEANRDAVNARRRELRRLKKASGGVTHAVVVPPETPGMG